MYQRACICCAAAAVLGVANAALGDTDVQRAICAAGVTPTMLTACGLSGDELRVFIANIRGSSELAGLLGAEAAATTTQQALDDAVRTQDPWTPDGYQRISAARASANVAKSALRTALEAFVARAAGNLNSSQLGRLSAWRTGRSDLPPEFRVVAWNEADGRAVAAALLEERLADAQQQPLSPDASQLLGQIRAREDVADALVRLTTNLASNTAAFEDAAR